jgi:hypothetical protein
MLAAFARNARQVERFLPLCATVTSTSAVNAAPTAASVAQKPPLLKDVLLYRFDPENDAKPYYKTYRVDVNKYVNKSAVYTIDLAAVPGPP